MKLLTPFILLLATATSARAELLFSDTQLPVSNYSTTLLNPTGGFNSSVAQAPSGGNPGAYRVISQFSSTSPASGATLHLHNNIYSPVSHPMNFLNITLDVNCFEGGTSGAVAFGLVIYQANTIYIGPTFTALTGSGWRSDLSTNNLTAANFTKAFNPPPESPTNPDLSLGGSFVQFGFYTSNGTASGTPISTSSGADNFSVNVFIPEPTTTLLGLPAFALLKRRR